MSNFDFMWPPKDAHIEIYVDLSNDLISLEEYTKKPSITKASIPAPAFLLYQNLKLPFNEWNTLIDGLRILSNTELLEMEADYIKNHPEEFCEC